jgi:peptide/nickel transport system substrate-binding protein
MERFDDYYGGSPDILPVGPAQVKTVIFKVIPETSSRIAALLAGEVDIIEKVPTDLMGMGQIEASSNATIATCNGTRSYFVGFNCSNGVFTDKKVRQAMNYAIDMQEIVATFYSGLGAVIPTILSEDFIKNVAQAYAQMLREVGIDASVQVWEWSILKPELLAGKRQMWLQDWGNGSMDPQGIFVPKLGTGARGNYTGYSNKTLDLLFSLSQITSDLTEREECFIQGQEIIYEECPMIWGYVTKEVYGVSKRVQNWTPSPDSRINLQDVSVSD